MTALVLRPLGELVRYAKKQKLWWRRYKAILGGQSPSTDTQQYIAFNSMHEDWQHRNVVVVDGLDEITGREAQERIVGIMEWATMQRPLPLRFIVSSSKSEGDHVVRKAMANLSQETCRLVTLGGSPIDNDILVFLNDEFARIQKEFSNRGGGSIPAEGWPGVGIVKKLVTNARGLFVYASTLVKLMDTPSRDPVLVLQQVLDASPQVDSTARYEQSYTELDALYSIILHPPDTDLDLIRRLLHAVMFSKDPFGSTSELEEQLLLHPGSVEAVLRDLHSIVSLPLETQTIRFHHRTIRDYLLSRERSRDMYIES
ncbi:hypothetical protein EST38_g10841 [Candolleomyces aberdarensis]|uniref:NACHT domain-containing protein n=1 Tax=Candolleomyces aberdarensis TaxID=2316362 RepID=A0A4V1Q2G6_9AGAR|nr:hypothetical protein EST38_g10841 [Candolleomyces aberdarensis]